MAVYKVFRIYRIEARNKWEALDQLKDMIAKGLEEDFLETFFAKEDEGTGWLSAIKWHILGK